MRDKIDFTPLVLAADDAFHAMEGVKHACTQATSSIRAFGQMYEAAVQAELQRRKAARLTPAPPHRCRRPNRSPGLTGSDDTAQRSA